MIINNGSFQVNFTKSKRATIRYTNSQWLSEDPTEASVGKVAVKNPVVNPTLIPSTVPIYFPSALDPAPEVPVGRVVVSRTGQKNALARRDATEAAVDRVAVSKTGQKPPSPRRDATGVLVGRVAVPKTGQKNSLPRRVGSGALVGRVPVPKTGQKNSLPRRDGSGVLVGRVIVPKQIVRRIIMVEVKVLVGYAPWQMVSGGIGSRKGKGPTKWEGPPGTICHGAIMNQLFLRRRHRLPKRRDPRSGKALPAPSATEQSWTGYFSGVGIGSRK
ncbi:MAG: hypothetical protein SOZ41_01110, partial [Candidatus Cryptobacteroides sp.]|nr:hypothetical protein [Candidatus Cryptobacteroides sp.]